MGSVTSRYLRPPPSAPPFRIVSRAPYLGAAAAGVGGLLVVLGFLSATIIPRDLYTDPLGGYDPPFDVIAGLLLLALSLRIRDRSPVAWVFSLLAPTMTIAIAILSPNVFSIASAVAATLLVTAIVPYRSGFFRGGGTVPKRPNCW